MSVIGKAWSTPLERMKVRGGRAKIIAVPILVTGVWKGTVVNEENINEVVAFQEKEGPIHLVADHLEDVGNWIGLAFNYRKNKNSAGYIEVLADIEITDEEIIKKLKYAKEQGGGFCGISPRIEWNKRDESGNVGGLSTPHVSIVIHPAQGWTTKMSAVHVSAYADLGIVSPPSECECPECGKIIEKERGVPCRSVDCPKCEAEMVARISKEDKSMAGLGIVKMSLTDLRKNAPKLCPECKEFTQENVSKCLSCGAKLTDYGVVKCQSCGAIFDLDTIEDDKCPNCSKVIKNLDIIIPLATIGENEDVVIPKPMLQEIDDILKNPKIDAAVMRGFFERLNEQLKIKEKEEEPEEEYPEKDKKKKDPEEGDDEAKKDPDDEDPDKEDKAAKKEKDPEEEEEVGEDDKKEHSVYVVPAEGSAEKIKEHVYSKELLGTCTIKHPGGIGMIPINEEFLSALVRNTKVAFGNRIPVYIGHPEVGKEPADKVIGWASDMTAGKSVMGHVSITNQLVHERIDEGTLKDGSVGLSLGWRDAQGRNIGPVLTHFAITTTPLIRKLKEFKKLVASATDTKVKVIEKVEGDPFGLNAIREEITEMKANHEKEMGEVSQKYEKIVKRDIQERKDKIMGRIDRLIESELMKPGVRERLEEWIGKTEGTVYDDKHSVPEAILDILEVGLVKGEVSLTKRESEDTSSTNREYLTGDDFDVYPRKIGEFTRAGIVSQDKNGRPYWANGRPKV